MGTQRRPQRPSIKDSFLKTPYRFEFHQSIRIIEALNKEATPIGEDTDPKKEALSLSARVQISVPPSDIYALQKGTDNAYLLEVNFLGLAGIQGPLPLPYTEYIMDRIRSRDKTLRDFLNLFNHRTLSILHRVRKKYSTGLHPVTADKTPLGQSMLALSGISHKEHVPDGVAPLSLLPYGALLWQTPRSSYGFLSLITDFFNISAQLLPFQGRWHYLEQSQYTYLGAQNKQMNVLGRTAALGTRVWNAQSAMTLKISALPLKTFLKFLKNGDAYQKLKQLTTFYLGANITLNLNLGIVKEDVIPAKLDGKTALGWTSWIKTHPFTEDDFQVNLTIDED